MQIKKNWSYRQRKMQMLDFSPRPMPINQLSHIEESARQ